MRWTSPGREPHRAEEPPVEFWLSYSDLMAGLLMVFTLMLLVTLYHYEERVQDIGDLVAARGVLIDSLRRTFPPGGDVSIDSAGTVRFRDAVLFDQGSDRVTEEGRQVLRRFGGAYLPVVFSKPLFAQQLSAIVIEGHTNDDGSYRLNLGLSQRRAFSVMEVLLEEAGEFEVALQQYVTANGRSFAELIRTEDGTADKVASRRIEIRLQFRDEELLVRVLRQVLRGQR